MTDKHKKVQISFSLYENIYNDLEKIMENFGQNRTAILRQAVHEFVMRYKTFPLDYYNSTDTELVGTL